MDSKNVYNMLKYAAFLTTIGYYEEAQAYYIHALELEPNFLHCLWKYANFLVSHMGRRGEEDGSGRTHSRTDHLHRARELYEKAIRIQQPPNPFLVAEYKACLATTESMADD